MFLLVPAHPGSPGQKAVCVSNNGYGIDYILCSLDSKVAFDSICFKKDKFCVVLNLLSFEVDCLTLMKQFYYWIFCSSIENLVRHV